MKKISLLIIYFLILIISTASCSKTDDQASESAAPAQELLTLSESMINTSRSTAVSYGIGDDLPVSRALACKMLTLALNDANYIDTLDREITFEDTEPAQWYDRYINAAALQGIMSGDENKFMPGSPLTLEQAQFLLNNMDSENNINIQIDDNNRNNPISYALWLELYQKLLDNLSGGDIEEFFGIKEENVIVLATPGNNGSLPEWNMITDVGPLSYRGFSMEVYIDKEIKVLTKGGEVICVLSLENSAPTIKNAYVAALDPISVTVFSGGAERTYSWINDKQDMSGGICDITIQDGSALNVVFYTEKTEGVVKKTTTQVIELEEAGAISLDENFKIYSVVSGPVKWKSLKDLTVGTDISEFIMKEGRICCAVILRLPSPETVRIAVNTTGFKGLIHESVSLTCNTGYSVKAGEESFSFQSGDVFEVSSLVNGELFGHERITIAPDKPEGRLRINSIKRAWPGDESPSYRGIFEISKHPYGYLLVNEVSLEEYLYAVVPSEMPTSYGVEAAKVQAVTARSYAYNQFYANRFHEYGANIDDSVTCQVYNNIPENQVSIQAVNETKGLCISHNEQIISANFFSTSAGVTANSGEVWASSVTKEFPTESPEYLRSAKQYDGDGYGDLSLEENAEAFFKASDIACYDSGFSWFRWNVSMGAADIAASINDNLNSRYAANQALIKTLQADGSYRSRSIESIGDLVDLEVVKRGEGGNIMVMKITGTSAAILVQTEYNVRALIRPTGNNAGSVTLNLNSGETMNNYSLMPSAFYVMDKSYDDAGKLISVTFYGGGNGHGVGMSQNGVKGMIDKGLSFEEILRHYYPETKLKSI